jgi:hypothetical protein
MPLIHKRIRPAIAQWSRPLRRQRQLKGRMRRRRNEYAFQHFARPAIADLHRRLSRLPIALRPRCRSRGKENRSRNYHPNPHSNLRLNTQLNRAPARFQHSADQFNKICNIKLEE